MNWTLLIVSLAVCTGCQTGGPTGSSNRLPNTTRTSTFFETGDLLYTQGLGEAGDGGFTKRIQGYLVENLSRQGIMTVGSDSFAAGDAKLIINLTTIEAVTVSDIGFFSPIVRQQPKVKYSAGLISGEGAWLFKFDDQQDDQSLDNLSKKIAVRIAGRVARCYR